MTRLKCRCGRRASIDRDKCTRCRTKLKQLGRPPMRRVFGGTWSPVHGDLPAHVIESIIQRAHAMRRPLWRHA